MFLVNQDIDLTQYFFNIFKQTVKYIKMNIELDIYFVLISNHYTLEFRIMFFQMQLKISS